MKAAWETVIAFKLVWLRVLLYIGLPTVSTFLSQTETWSGDTWEHTHWFLNLRLVIGSAVPGCLALAAFIDQSLARAREELKTRRTETEHIERKDIIP